MWHKLWPRLQLRRRRRRPHRRGHREAGRQPRWAEDVEDCRVLSNAPPFRSFVQHDARAPHRVPPRQEGLTLERSFVVQRGARALPPGPPPDGKDTLEGRGLGRLGGAVADARRRTAIRMVCRPLMGRSSISSAGCSRGWAGAANRAVAVGAPPRRPFRLCTGGCTAPTR